MERRSVEHARQSSGGRVAESRLLWPSGLAAAGRCFASSASQQAKLTHICCRIFAHIASLCLSLCAWLQEAQWILSVLDDISHKLTLASLLTPEILKDKVCDSLDAELLLTLKEHFQVENQYHEFLDSDLWKQNAHEPKNQELFRELDLCLADSTRTVTRLLKQHPALVRRLRELGLKRSSATLDFLNTFSRLRGLVHAKLRMTAEEERNMREQLAELKVLEEEDTHRFVELTERLAVERNEHEHALAEKERKITRLSAQIAQLTQRTQQERQMFEEKMREDNEAAEKAFKAAEKDLLKQLDSVRTRRTRRGATAAERCGGEKADAQCNRC